jgi:predicted nucleic acid-binding protein
MTSFHCTVKEIKRKDALVPDVDLLIAATAISKNLSLISNDVHFEKLVPFGLNLIK